MEISKRICTMLLAVLFLSWPALYNGYPLLYPDSMSYLQSGAPVARTLLLRQFSSDYGGRSLIYCLGILPLHWNFTAWPIVIFNALLTAFILRLVVRSILPRSTAIHLFALITPLGILTGLSWFVAWIMPDIFGPLLYLSIYLLVFASQELSRAERLALILISCWAAASHITHLLLAAALCISLLLVFVLQRRLTPQRLRAIAAVAISVLAVAASHITLHTYLYGEPSLNGKGPPFLMARVIGDGPGKWYLQQHCGSMQMSICTHLDHLPDSAGDFLWADQGIWLNSSVQEEEQLRRDEMAVVLGTLRSYPRQELLVSADRFFRQLHAFALSNYDPNTWIFEMIDTVLPGTRARYLRTRQAREVLHEDFFSAFQKWTVIASLGVIVSCIFIRRRCWSPRLVALTALIAFVLITNAAITGVLSEVDDRYQGRVIWLVPLLAGLFLLQWFDQRNAPPSPFSTPHAIF